VADDMDRLVEAGFDEIVLVLCAVSFMDSTGLRLVIRQTRRPDLSVRIVDGPTAVAHAFDLTGLRAQLQTLGPESCSLWASAAEPSAATQPECADRRNPGSSCRGSQRPVCRHQSPSGTVVKAYPPGNHRQLALNVRPRLPPTKERLLRCHLTESFWLPSPP
jgi:hypothetical protein